MLRFYLKSMLQILCNLYPFLKTMSMKLWNCLWFDIGKSNLTFLTFFFNFQIMHWRMPPFWVLQSNLPAKLWGNKVCILPFYILVICLICRYTKGTIDLLWSILSFGITTHQHSRSCWWMTLCGCLHVCLG